MRASVFVFACFVGCFAVVGSCANVEAFDLCDNGLDDDGDGRTDCDDESCGFSNTCGDCGDGVLGDSEACDDGNHDDGDGCSARCFVEGCTDPDGCGPDRTPLTPCGDSVLQPGEECEDGNTAGEDGCDASCHAERDRCDPNNGIDQCFDDDGLSGDGCSASCSPEILRRRHRATDDRRALRRRCARRVARRLLWLHHRGLRQRHLRGLRALRRRQPQKRRRLLGELSPRIATCRDRHEGGCLWPASTARSDITACRSRPASAASRKSAGGCAWSFRRQRRQILGPYARYGPPVFLAVDENPRRETPDELPADSTSRRWQRRPWRRRRRCPRRRRRG